MTAREHIENASLEVMIRCSEHLGINLESSPSREELKRLCNYMITNRSTLWGSKVIPKSAMSRLKFRVGIAAAIHEIQEVFRQEREDD